MTVFGGYIKSIIKLTSPVSFYVSLLWLLEDIFIYLFFWLRHAACRILVPQPGVEPGPRQWKRGVLTPGPPGNSRRIYFFLFIYFFKFFYLWLCWVFVSVRGLSLVAASGGHSSSRCAGLSLSRPLLAEHRLQTRRLSNCSSRVQLLRGMWDLPRPGLEPVSPALAGRLSTTAPPGKPPEEFKLHMQARIWFLLDSVGLANYSQPWNI